MPTTRKTIDHKIIKVNQREGLHIKVKITVEVTLLHMSVSIPWKQIININNLSSSLVTLKYPGKSFEMFKEVVSLIVYAFL